MASGRSPWIRLIRFTFDNRCIIRIKFKIRKLYSLLFYCSAVLVCTRSQYIVPSHDGTGAFHVGTNYFIRAFFAPRLKNNKKEQIIQERKEESRVFTRRGVCAETLTKRRPPACSMSRKSLSH